MWQRFRKWLNIDHIVDLAVDLFLILFDVLSSPILIVMRLLRWIVGNYLLDGVKNKIKRLFHNLGHGLFREESIVDLDVRTKGIKKEKRSFMNLECTLYVLKDLSIKSDDLKLYMKSLMVGIIDECLNNDLLYNFHKNKK